MLRVGYVIAILALLALILSACQPVPAPLPAATAAPPTATAPPPPPATTAPTPVAAAPTPRPTVAAPQMAVKTDQITSAALAGNLFGDPATRPFYVLLPPSYDASETRYPVVYVLHWFTGDESTLVWKFKAEMDKLLAAGEVEEMILVFPNANNRLLGSMYLSSPTIGDYETYIAQELVGYVDANYRTLAQPASRGITGCSMGGDGAIHLALKYPAVFSVAARTRPPMTGLRIPRSPWLSPICVRRLKIWMR
jgi:enterochelin esterase-like enzyme